MVDDDNCSRDQKNCKILLKNTYVEMQEIEKIISRELHVLSILFE